LLEHGGRAKLKVSRRSIGRESNYGYKGKEATT